MAEPFISISIVARVASKQAGYRGFLANDVIIIKRNSKTFNRLKSKFGLSVAEQTYRIGALITDDGTCYAAIKIGIATLYVHIDNIKLIAQGQ